MNNIADRYISGLKQAYYGNNARDTWEHFESIKQGATKEDIEGIKQIFPDVPESLTDLLRYVDGTYWREYSGEILTLYFLGSDVEEYPYYLLSAKEMIENRDQATKYYSEYIKRIYDEVEVDNKITNDAKVIKWLHFSDCMNNGGTSQLFIDFTPSPEGNKGQIVRFLHDPDEMKVIAGSFDEYLQNLIDHEFDFVREDVSG